MTLQEFTPVFAVLALQLRATDADEPMVRAYYRVLAELEPELVQAAAERLARAVNSQGESWFPKVGEWRAMVTTVDLEKQQAQRAFLSRLPTPLCLGCDDTGWEPCGDGVRPCSCRRLRRLELLGRAPWPSLTAGDPTVAPRALPASVLKAMS